MLAYTSLTIREENELHVAIASNLIDHVSDGTISHLTIRESLRSTMATIGVGHTDDFIVQKVQESIHGVKKG